VGPKLEAVASCKAQATHHPINIGPSQSHTQNVKKKPKLLTLCWEGVRSKGALCAKHSAMQANSFVEHITYHTKRQVKQRTTLLKADGERDREKKLLLPKSM